MTGPIDEPLAQRRWSNRPELRAVAEDVESKMRRRSAAWRESRYSANFIVATVRFPSCSVALLCRTAAPLSPHATEILHRPFRMRGTHGSGADDHRSGAVEVVAAEGGASMASTRSMSALDAHGWSYLTRRSRIQGPESSYLFPMPSEPPGRLAQVCRSHRPPPRQQPSQAEEMYRMGCWRASRSPEASHAGVRAGRWGVREGAWR